jgi:hypothetical protein
MGVGAKPPTPNPQSPIPNPHLNDKAIIKNKLINIELLLILILIKYFI